MNDAKTMIKKELAAYGIQLLGGNLCAYFADGQLVETELVEMDKHLKERLNQNKSLMKELWSDMVQNLGDSGERSRISDPRSNRMFVESLKDLSVWLKMFDPKDVERYINLIDSSMHRDAMSFSEKQKEKIVETKICIDWVHRMISRISYMRRLIKFAYKNKEAKSHDEILTAAGVGGPWSNLDLPVRERVWKWLEEDENFRSRDRDIRNQRRYRKGLENYNKEEVGEGHYWREIRNEPYKWSDRESESPYPGRNTLFWG